MNTTTNNPDSTPRAMAWELMPDGGGPFQQFTDDAHALALLSGRVRSADEALRALRANPWAILNCNGGRLRYVPAKQDDAT